MTISHSGGARSAANRRRRRGLPFFEAIRQIKNDLPPNHAIFYIHLTCGRSSDAGEVEDHTDPSSVKELRSIGIHRSILFGRTDREIPKEERRNSACFCNVRNVRDRGARRPRQHLQAVPGGLSVTPPPLRRGAGGIWHRAKASPRCKSLERHQHLVTQSAKGR